jgi:hypothetical protein
MEGAAKTDLTLIVDNDAPDLLPQTDKPGIKEDRQHWPLFGLSIGSFVQVIAMEQQTCILEVYRGVNNFGHFYFVGGALHDAVCGNLNGEEAAMEMVSWENVRLNIKQVLNTSSISRRIEKSLMLLLMESSKRHDEEKDKNIEIEDEIKDTINGEIRMKLEACLDVLKNQMVDGLVAATISATHSDGVCVTYNTKPEVQRLFTNLIRYLDKTFRNNAIVGPLGDHFVIDLKGNLTLVVLLFGEYEWSILFNNTLCTLGLFRNVIMPGVISTFNDKHIPGNP